MSAKRSDITPELLKRILPALRMMVRFPSMPAKNISFQTGIELTEIYSYTEVRGRPKQRDIEAIEKELEEGVAQKPRRATAAQIAKARSSVFDHPRATVNIPDSARNTEPQMQPPPAANIVAPTSDIGRWLEQQRAKITARINCFQVEVTPLLATAWLTLNTGNRRPSKAKIKRFAASMKANRWALNGETIKFSVTGRLLDGQSRLMAIQQAGIAVVMEIRAGLPDIAQQSMDVGELRKGTHTLEMMGEANPLLLAPAMKWAWLWEKGWFVKKPFGRSVVMENFEVAPFLDAHTGLKDSVGWCVSVGKNIANLMPASEGAFLHYLLGGHREQRDAFFEGLVDGVGLTKASPVYHLRERLLSARVRMGGKPLNRVERAALTIKAWNLVTRGEKATSLTFSKTEAFPAITAEKGAAA